MASEGQRELDAARKRLAAAKSQASSAAKALESAKQVEESAKQMAVMAKKNADDASKNREALQSQQDNTSKEVKEAQEFLEKAEKRWQVYKVETDDETDESPPKKKQKKAGPAKSVIVKGLQTQSANGTYEKSDELYNGKPIYCKEGICFGEDCTFGVWCRKSDSRWVIGYFLLKGCKDYNEWYVGSTATGEFADVPPKDGWTRGGRQRQRSIKVTPHY